MLIYTREMSKSWIITVAAINEEEATPTIFMKKMH